MSSTASTPSRRPTPGPRRWAFARHGFHPPCLRLSDPNALCPDLPLQQVADLKAGKNRIRLDVHTLDMVAELERLRRRRRRCPAARRRRVPHRSADRSTRQRVLTYRPGAGISRPRTAFEAVGVDRFHARRRLRWRKRTEPGGKAGGFTDRVWRRGESAKVAKLRVRRKLSASRRPSRKRRIPNARSAPRSTKARRRPCDARIRTAP